MYEKELYYILSERTVEKPLKKDALKNTAVAVYLYYSDTLEKYFEYIKNIPIEIDVHIISANPETWEAIETFVESRKNVSFIKKENRGRDVSALLVVFRKIAINYQYFCFIHDKKEKTEFMKQDIDFWVRNLWDNTLKSKSYIQNVLGILECENVGLLVPPEPTGEHKSDWYRNVWYDNFEQTKALAEELGLECDIATEKSPITLGTVFWAKTDALKKLLEKEWKYEDFPEEPLPDDGAVSHAIERILAYVAQDAGYDTGIAMCSSYAEKLLLYAKSNLTEAYSLMTQNFGIRNIHQVKHYNEQKHVIENFFQTYDKIYLYGAGLYGKEFLHMLNCLGYRPDGFVVSDGQKKMNTIDGVPVLELKELNPTDNVGIFITVNYGLQQELETALLKRGFKNYFKAYVC